MKQHAKIAAALAATLTVSVATTAKTYKVYYLGGQSNMVGFGYNSKLPETLNSTNSTIPIFNGYAMMDEGVGGGDGQWAALSPGFGLGVEYKQGQNVLSDRYGPELAFAAHLQAQYPDDNIALIKYAWGGTALVDGVSGYGSWDPGVAKINQYDYFLNTVHQAMSASDIDGDGETDTLIPAGIVWMQGEADAFDNQPAADNYLSNLRQLMALIRAAFHDKDLPVVIGKITDSKRGQDQPVMQYAEKVRQAQEQFADSDPCATISRVTEQIQYQPGDDWHYDSQGYLKMGEDFAVQMMAVQKRCN